jgi:hypothetical protein
MTGRLIVLLWVLSPVWVIASGAGAALLGVAAGLCIGTAAWLGLAAYVARRTRG